MSDCKKALVEANGDLKEAIEILRKKGAASAAKRSDRSANEGIVISKVNESSSEAAIVELNCETDFVARNQDFVDYAEKLVNTVLNTKVKTMEELLNQKISDDTVQDIHNEILAKFSENISIRRFEFIESKGYIANYIHPGSRLSVLVELSCKNPNEKAKSLIHDIAMQIAAMNPSYISRDDVQSEHLQKEIEIYKEHAINEGKKPEIAERIAQGRIEKFFQEQCLLEQAFVKDAAKTVKDVVDEISKEMEAEIKILSFRRYFLGESLD
jgi:elongation factor Ts